MQAIPRNRQLAYLPGQQTISRLVYSILEEREFPASEVIALASRKSVGKEVSYGDKILKCKDLATFDFTGVDFCLMSWVDKA